MHTDTHAAFAKFSISSEVVDADTQGSQKELEHYGHDISNGCVKVLK